MTPTNTPTAAIVHAWARRGTARAKWQRVASGTAEECAKALAEFQKRNPSFSDSYTGVNDPNIPVYKKSMR
jgi:hypothetical protein